MCFSDANNMVGVSRSKALLKPGECHYCFEICVAGVGKREEYLSVGKVCAENVEN